MYCRAQSASSDSTVAAAVLLGEKVNIESPCLAASWAPGSVQAAINSTYTAEQQTAHQRPE